jgi:DnaJ-class molecular chaperone
MPIYLKEIYKGVEKTIKVTRNIFSERFNNFSQETELITIKIPRGIRYGSKIEVPERGDQLQKGYPPASLIFTIVPQPDDPFELVEGTRAQSNQTDIQKEDLHKSQHHDYKYNKQE